MKRLTAILAITLALGASAGATTLAGAATAAAGTQPVASVQPAAASIKVLSSRAFTASGYLHIVGDVKNTTTVWRKYVEIDVRLYNASGHILASDFTFTTLDLVGPGKRSPFHFIRETPAGYDHYKLSTTSSTTSDRPIGHLKISKGTPYTDFGYRHYPGEVTNNNGFKTRYTEIVITLFDANGRVVNTDFTFTDPSTVPAHATRGFEAIFSDHFSGVSKVRYQVQASR